jgi:putative transposase
MVSVPARRLAVAYATGRGLSQRRACTLIGVGRSALRYRSRKAEKDAPVVRRMAELSARYPRYGYRRIRIFLGRDGHRMSAGRAYRLWRGARLQVPRRRPRKRLASGRPRPQAPTGPNQVWAYDFVFDRCANGQQLKCLTVSDEWTKEGLAIEVDGRIRSQRVIEVLARLISTRGAPLYLRSDNGPEFVARALLKWVVEQGIKTALIDPGKPWQNGVGESFNGKFRDECLGLEWFRSRAEAKVVIECWRRHYNAVRPHSSLGYLTPEEFVAKHRQTTDDPDPGPQRVGSLELEKFGFDRTLLTKWWASSPIARGASRRRASLAIGGAKMEDHHDARPEESDSSQGRLIGTRQTARQRVAGMQGVGI